MRNTKEFQDLQAHFEANAKNYPMVASLRFDREKERPDLPKSCFYECGYTNAIFIAFMHGSAWAKCYFRD